MIIITILLRTHPRITIKASRRKVPRLTPRLKRVHPTRDTRQHYFLLRRSNVRRTNLNLPTDTRVTPTNRRHITISKQAIDAELRVTRSAGTGPLGARPGPAPGYLMFARSQSATARRLSSMRPDSLNGVS